MIEYEKHLLESDLEKNNYTDNFSKYWLCCFFFHLKFFLRNIKCIYFFYFERGKVFMQNMNIDETPVKQKLTKNNEDSDD